ncbi:PKD domain-containing protein [Candidatus Woesearchaeota archaeon]|nr:PKD domain-containing protein [Candidatus Woesearchaeota archaeon]
MVKKLFLYATVFLILITSVFAANSVTFHYYNQDGNDVNNVEVSVFECTDSTCTSLTGTSTSDRAAYDDTGSTNDAVLNIPAVHSPTWFVAYAFAEATDTYLPNYQTFYLTGNGASGAMDIILEQKDNCQSEIQSFTVTNSVAPGEPIYVDFEAALDATTASAFILNDAVYPWAYDSSETSRYQEWYTSDVDVDLTIAKILTLPGPHGGTIFLPVHTDSTSLSILAEETQNVEFIWTPTTEGTYRATVTTHVTDGECASTKDDSAYDTFHVIKPLYAPVADAGGFLGMYWSYDDYIVSFDGSGSYDTDPDGSGYIVSYEWDFTGDGITDATGVNPTFTFPGNGDYTATLTVTDNDGLTDTDSATVHIFVYTLPDFDFQPTADCGGPYAGSVDESIAFDGSGSFINMLPVTYAWDFGDGSTSTEEDPTHMYSAEGTYAVTLTVTDTDGDTDSCSTTATITVPANSAPRVDCSTIPTTGTTDEAVALQVSATDSDGTVTEYDWDFGDGNIGSTPTDSTSHTYTTAGDYLTTVVVTDDAGATGSCSQNIIITDAPLPNNAPTADCSLIPSTADVLENVHFDGSGSTDSDGTLVNYDWDFGYLDPSGNSMGVSGPTLSETDFGYAEAGVYAVTLTVTDDAGATGSCTASVDVTEVTPVEEDLPATAVASVTPNSGEPTLWVRFSSAGSSGNEPLSYFWTFSEGGSSTLANPGHYYNKEGTYSATLTVTDADGDTDSDIVIVTVTNKLANIGENHYYIDGIALSNDGRVNAGDDLELWVSAENIAGIDKNAVSFNAIIQELSVYETSGEFDLEAEDKETKVLSIHIPANTTPGIYYIRVTVSDDDVHRVIYRDIIVS